MRESNFAFPAQNRACVCITSQLYDRRALDTTSPLPLFNSLTQLVYLTSTSPRIREIMTMDGGLERLVRILYDFCLCPPPPENPAILYGLSPPTARPPKLVPTLNPQSFDKHAAYRFSLAFQCLVNIGVRGSEPIRSRVVQAGTLDVVGCILEAWLANKGFAVGPSSSMTGMPRETKEQRQVRRAQRQAQEIAELHQALRRRQLEQVEMPMSAPTEDESMEDSTLTVAARSTSSLSVSRPGTSESSSHPNSDTDTSTDTSANTTPVGSTTPTTTVLVPGRDRSGTVVGRRMFDEQLVHAGRTPTATRQRTIRARPSLHEHHRSSPTPSPDTSRPETETEDDGDAEADRDGDVDMDRIRRVRNTAGPVPSASPSPERRPSISLTRPTRRTVGIVSDDPPTTSIMISDAGSTVDVVTVGGEGGVEEGIVSLEQNDDFAMGAPPGAPGAIDDGTAPRRVDLDIGLGPRVDERGHLLIPGANAPDITPRAGLVNLPAVPSDARTGQGQLPRRTPGPARLMDHERLMPNAIPNTTPIGHSTRGSPSHHHRESDAGPYRDEDVLLSLQLLAYLSKYPHVRQAFYKPRVSFHPASAHLPGRNYPGGVQESESSRNGAKAPAVSMKDTFLRTFGRGKEKERASPSSTYGSFTAGASGSSSSPNGASSSSASYKTYPAAPATTPPLVRQTNVFSLVERFTFRPSASENDLFNAPPKLPPEIQYWAGVIMRNACRKDESRGGIRQCANMLCGRWESYPREFAKCRRCRKAKYCGKDCQSTAWSEGHRFWCSAKDGDDEGLHAHESSSRNAAAANSAPEADAEVELPAASGDDPAAARPHNGTHNLTTGGTIRAGTRQRVMALVEPRTRPVVPNTNDRAEEGLAFAGLHVGTSRFVPPINTATADATGALLHTMFSASLPTSPTTIGPTPTASRTRRPAEDSQVALGFRYHAGDTSTSTTADHRDVREGRRHPPQREQLSATEYDSRQLADVLALYSHSGRSNPSPRSTLRARPEHLRAQIMDQQASGSPSESYTHPASGSTTSSPIPPPRRRYSGHPTADPLMIPHYSTETYTAESSPTARSQRTPMEDTRRRRHQVDSSDQDMVIG